MNQSTASAARFYALRLAPGQELLTELRQFITCHGLQAAWIAGCTGSLTDVALRYAGREESTRLCGTFEVIALSGTLELAGEHLHLSIADENGALLGAVLLGPVIGMLTGLLTNLLWGLLTDPIAAAFAPVAMVIGLTADWLAVCRQRQTTLLAISHDYDFTRRHFPCVIRLADGQISADGLSAYNFPDN